MLFTLACFAHQAEQQSKKILLNQNLPVTKSKLEELLKVKGVEINLPAFIIREARAGLKVTVTNF